MFKKLYTLIGCLGAFSSALYPGWAFSTCEFKEQSDYKCESVGLSSERFNDVIWE